MKLEYSISNENPEAIVKGLNLQPTDRVLAILGAGDQAFAMLEFCAEVYAVDNNPAQIEYFKRRIEKLKKGQEIFLEENGTCDENRLIDLEGYNFLKQKKLLQNYFSEQRVKKVRKKLEKLTIEEDKIQFRVIGGGFNKLYFSNVTNQLNACVNFLPQGCLIYCTSEVYSRGLKIDKNLAKIARKFEGKWWCPTILRKEK